MGAAAVLCFLLLAFLLIFKKFNKFIKAKIVEILKKFFFNNIIRSFNIAYVKLTVSFSLIIFLNE